MGIFSRFRDIISSNINAMLEKAENPEKLIKLMIQEMEDTLVEIKASCAGAMASHKRVKRAHEEVNRRAENWGAKAKLAVEKGREDLAREALAENMHLEEEGKSLEKEVDQFANIITQYQKDIHQLEEKLETARKKHRILLQRHVQAGKRKTAQTKIRQVDSSDAFVRFEQFENRIERMEAEAELVNYGRKPSEENAWENLENKDKIEEALETLKKEHTKKSG